MKKLREKFDLTQQDLADIAGVTNKAVSAWETGQKEPRMGAIEKIAQHFGIKKSNLIEDGGMNDLSEDPLTIAAHFDGEDFTKEELDEILEYAKYIKSRRK
ncbi:helix-turn-helix transcriptional regulator [Paenibacillus chibensis]|uniref:Helix-turn-helix transcriptional regulator n=1 Tax=Paenibacillus chibensis TaxID=59846 RepID=A0ABU6PWN7_9BACL|nr:helix-turn-helix transcriptional regulator [Paenibacillus chibensis]